MNIKTKDRFIQWIVTIWAISILLIVYRYVR